MTSPSTRVVLCLAGPESPVLNLVRGVVADIFPRWHAELLIDLYSTKAARAMEAVHLELLVKNMLPEDVHLRENRRIVDVIKEHDSVGFDLLPVDLVLLIGAVEDVIAVHKDHVKDLVLEEIGVFDRMSPDHPHVFKTFQNTRSPSVHPGAHIHGRDIGTCVRCEIGCAGTAIGPKFKDIKRPKAVGQFVEEAIVDGFFELLESA